MAAALQNLSILLVDDSGDDRFFLKRILAKHPLLKICGEVEDGEEAISYIQGTGPYANRSLYPFPDLVILDLKMPRKSGYEVLEWLQQTSSPLPVFVLSGSNLEQDRMRCLGLGAKAYSSKTMGLRHKENVIKEIEKWAQSVP